MKLNLTTIVMISIMAILLIAGCTTIVTPGPGKGNLPGTDLELGTYEDPGIFDPDENLNVQSFSSIAEFNDFVKNAGDGYGGGYYGVFSSTGAMRAGGEVMMDMAVESNEMAPQAMKAVGGADLDYSETNVQVAGVDEADIIKTDGNYIYTVTDKTLFIIKAYPGEDAEVVSKMVFENQPTSLFVNGDSLAVFGEFYDLDFFQDINFRPSQGMAYFNIYDISDKSEPELVKEYKFEGYYFESRMIGDYVYFITATRPEYRTIHPTPVIMEDTAVREIPVSSIFRYNKPYSDPQFANIHAINLGSNSKQVTSKTIVVEGSQNMYMSKNNIYITYTQYINEWEIQQQVIIDLLEKELTDADRVLIEKIKDTDNDVLSYREKQMKILTIIMSYMEMMSSDEQDDWQEQAEAEMEKRLEKYEYREYTLIHKVTVEDDEITIGPSGEVPGHVINQFSMDEYENVFRIATTISRSWSRTWSESTPSTNNIFTLDEDLEEMDSLTGLAEGEQIYSTRFMGERLYMVTFRQVDPFFVIDLSNPNSIKALGELKIPGFSRYLHPYDEDHIIGIGRDASDTGRTQGLKISLFDVSDVENPEEVAKFVTKEKYAQSTAEFEHKAFLFSKEKNLLVIPAYSQSYSYYRNNADDQDYNGAMVFDIDSDSIELRGIIDHTVGQNTGYGPFVERSLYIEELLYTKSPRLL
ncbi:MAG: beta-propeller domain-containing protein, partial [archaeon]